MIRDARIVPLAEEHTGILAQALYREWHDFAPWSSVDKIHAYYRECLTGADLPVAFAVVDKTGALLASAALKRHDMESFPQYEYWLGDVFVLPEYRGMGLGKLLVQYCIDQAKGLGIKQLYLYTPDVQKVYEAFGWYEIKQHWHNGETVSVMCLDL